MTFMNPVAHPHPNDMGVPPLPLGSLNIQKKLIEERGPCYKLHKIKNYIHPSA